MVEVYTDSYAKRHYAGLVSNAVIYRVVSQIGLIILAILSAYSSGGLWDKYTHAVEQPNVSSTYDMVFLVHDGTDDRIWTPYSAINNALGNVYLPAEVQVLEKDNNGDGKTDVIDIILETSAARMTSVR